MDIRKAVDFFVAFVITYYFSILQFTTVYIKTCQNKKIYATPDTDRDMSVLALKHRKDITIYISVTLIVLLIGFISLYYLSRIQEQNDIIASGIHIPLILALCGLITRLFNYCLVKDKQYLKKIDGQSIIMICSLCLTLCTIVAERRIGLFVLAITLGKFIWLDIVYEFKSISHQAVFFIHNVLDDKNLPTYMAIVFSVNLLGAYVIFSLFHLLFKEFPDEWYYMCSVYIVYFSGWLIADSNNRTINSIHTINEAERIEKSQQKNCNKRK